MIRVKCPHCDQLFDIEVPVGTRGYDMAMAGWADHAPEVCVEVRRQDEETINALAATLRPDTGGRDLTAADTETAWMEAARAEGAPGWQRIAEHLNRIARAAVPRPSGAGDDTAPPAELVARCEGWIDGDEPGEGETCTGEIRFRWGMSQSDPCTVCRGRCGVAVAAWDRVERPGAGPRAGADAPDEAEPSTGGLRALSQHVGIDVEGKDITVAGRVVDPAPAAERDTLRAPVEALLSELPEAGFPELGRLAAAVRAVLDGRDTTPGPCPRCPAKPYPCDTCGQPWGHCAPGCEDSTEAHASTTPGPDTAPDDELRNRAERQAAADRRMRELGGGVGLLGHHHPDMFEDMLTWDDSSDNHHADTVLALLDRLDRLRSGAAALRAAGDELSEATRNTVPSKNPELADWVRLDRACKAWRSAAGTPTTDETDGA